MQLFTIHRNKCCDGSSRILGKAVEGHLISSKVDLREGGSGGDNVKAKTRRTNGYNQGRKRG